MLRAGTGHLTLQTRKLAWWTVTKLDKKLQDSLLSDPSNVIALTHKFPLAFVMTVHIFPCLEGVEKKEEGSDM